jgi:hypothetical protein
VTTIIIEYIAELTDFLEVHQKDFPVLGSLARDYHACSATVGRTFLAAADICATGRSAMAIQTIE